MNNISQPVAVQPETAVPIPASPTASWTSTPFQLLPPTPSPSASVIPSPTPDPSPSPTKSRARPTPFPVTRLQDLPEEQVRVLLLGTDARPGGGYRTDVMLLVTINPRQGTASVVSFPRDLFVLIPGLGYDRLNSAMQFGFTSMAATFQYNFGVVPQHYMLTSFNGFEEIIDTLDGVDVEVDKPLRDSCDLPIQDGEGFCSIEPGKIRMDGKTALWYIRSRHTSDDFDRLRRAQEVLQAIFNKLVHERAFARLPEYYKLLHGTIETDMDLKEMLELAPIVPYLQKEGAIRHYTLTPVEAIPTVLLDGAQILTPNTPAILEMIRKAVNTE